LGGALYAIPNFECRYDMIWCDIVIVVLFYMGITQPVPLIKISQKFGEKNARPNANAKSNPCRCGRNNRRGTLQPIQRAPARPNAALLKPMI
jgi:hypothetical protein